MNSVEATNLLALICSAYPMVELTKERIAVWEKYLSDVSFETAIANVDHHIKTSHFPPAIADVIKAAEPEDPEIEARNILIAHQEWVEAGNDPEAFVYERTSAKRLASG